MRLVSHRAQTRLPRCGDKNGIKREREPHPCWALLSQPKLWRWGSSVWDRTGGSEPGRSSFVPLLGPSPASGCPGECGVLSTVTGAVSWGVQDSKDSSQICEVGVKLPQNGAKAPLLMGLQLWELSCSHSCAKSFPACGAQAPRSSVKLLLGLPWMGEGGDVGLGTILSSLGT